LKEDRKRMRNRVKIILLYCGEAGKVIFALNMGVFVLKED
jgi:hypothetical protein